MRLTQHPDRHGIVFVASYGLTLLACLLLIGCATPQQHVHSADVAAQAEHSPDHHAPSDEAIAARTSLRREAIKAAEIAYGAAFVAAELALDNKRLSQQDRDELPAIIARASDALDSIRLLEKADETTFVAAMYYLNYATNDLTLRAEKGIEQ